MPCPLFIAIQIVKILTKFYESIELPYDEAGRVLLDGNLKPHMLDE
jgi:hypothetical protein